MRDKRLAGLASGARHLGGFARCATSPRRLKPDASSNVQAKNPKRLTPSAQRHLNHQYVVVTSHSPFTTA